MTHLDELKKLSSKTLHMLICNHVLAVKRTREANGLRLWAVVRDLVCVGSGSAYDLCRRANLNPDQLVTKSLKGWDSFQSITE